MEEVRERKPRGQTKQRLIEFGETSGMHGVVKFTMDIGYIKIIFWAVFLTIMGAICIWQLAQVCNQYFSYSTSTTIDVTYSRKLSFPAVTFCNVSPIRKNDFHNLPADNSLKIYLDTIVSESTGFTGPSFTGNFDWNNIDSQNQRTDFNTKQDTYSHLANLKKEELQSAGSTINSMLLDCSFNGLTCSPANFTWFPNAVYGNCYTFNMPSENGGAVKYTDEVGPLYGFSLTLAIDQDEYLHQLAESAGMRMIVHDQNNMPFPEDEGILLAPGYYTQVSVKREEIVRAESPWGRCKTHTTEEIDALIAYRDILPVGYNSKMCDFTCTQIYIVQDCSCMYPLYPGGNTQLIKNISGDDPYCFLSNVETGKCIEAVKTKAHRRTYDCEGTCPPSCTDTHYDTRVTSAAWPADAKVEDVLSMIGSVIPPLHTKIMAKPQAERAPYLEKNMVKVDVFYSTLDYATMTTSAAYSWEEFISDIGGTVELWLGLSIVTFIEVGEAIIDILVSKVRKRKQKTVAVSGEPDNKVV